MSAWVHPLSHLSATGGDVESDSSDSQHADSFYSQESIDLLQAAAENDVDLVKELMPGALSVVRPRHLTKYSHGAGRRERTGRDEQGMPEPFVLHAVALLAIQHHSASLLQLVLSASVSVPPNTIAASLDPDAHAPLDHPIRQYFPQRLVDQRSPPTLLSWACADPLSLPCARLILSAGANPNAKDGKQRSPLVFAAWNECVETVRLLAEHRCNVDDRNGERGWTALHYAAKGGRAEVVKVLVEVGANTDVKDRQGKTAGEVAREEGREEVVKVLEWASDPLVGPLLRLPSPTSTVSHIRDTLLSLRDTHTKLSSTVPHPPSTSDDAIESLIDSTPTTDTDTADGLTTPAERSLHLRMVHLSHLSTYLSTSLTHVSHLRHLGTRLESTCTTCSTALESCHADTMEAGEKVARLTARLTATRELVSRAETDVLTALDGDTDLSVGPAMRDAADRISGTICTKIEVERTRIREIEMERDAVSRCAETAERVMQVLEKDILAVEVVMSSITHHMSHFATSLHTQLTSTISSARTALSALSSSLSSSSHHATVARSGGLDKWARDLEGEKERCEQHMEECEKWIGRLEVWKREVEEVKIVEMEVVDGKVFYGNTVQAVKLVGGGGGGGGGKASQHHPADDTIYRYRLPTGGWGRFYLTPDGVEVHFDAKTGEEWVEEPLGGEEEGTVDEFADLGMPVDIPESEIEQRRVERERVSRAREAAVLAAGRAGPAVRGGLPPTGCPTTQGGHNVGGKDRLAAAKVVTISRGQSTASATHARRPTHPLRPTSPSTKSHSHAPAVGKHDPARQIDRDTLRRLVRADLRAGHGTSTGEDTYGSEESADDHAAIIRESRERGTSRSRSRPSSPTRDRHERAPSPTRGKESGPPWKEPPSKTKTKPKTTPTSSEMKAAAVPQREVPFHSPGGFHVHIHGAAGGVGSNNESWNPWTRAAKAPAQEWTTSTSESDLDTIYMGKGGKVREYVTPGKALKMMEKHGHAVESKKAPATTSRPASPSPSPAASGPVYKNYITISPTGGKSGPSRLVKSTSKTPVKDSKGKSRVDSSPYSYEQPTHPGPHNPWLPNAYPNPYAGMMGMYPPMPGYSPPPVFSPYGAGPPHLQFAGHSGGPVEYPRHGEGSRFAGPGRMEQREYGRGEYQEEEVEDVQPVGRKPVARQPAVGMTRPSTPCRTPTSPSRPVSTHQATARPTTPSPTTPTKPAVPHRVPAPHAPPTVRPTTPKPRPGDFERAEAEVSGMYAQYIAHEAHGAHVQSTPASTPRATQAHVSSSSHVTQPSPSSSSHAAPAPTVAASHAHSSLPSGQANGSGASSRSAAPAKQRTPEDWVKVAEEENEGLYGRYLSTHGKR